ncbi:MAG: tol-pal system protein YbgF [Candidatus Eisenbacteria bacterium]
MKRRSKARTAGTGIVLAVPAVVLLSGCYGTKTLRQPITVEEIASDVAEIRSGQEEIREDVRSIEEQLTSQAETIRTLQTENQYLYKELESRLTAIDAKLGDAIGRDTGYSDGSPYWSGSSPNSDASPDWTGAATSYGGVSEDEAGNRFENLDSDPSTEPGGTPSVLDREYVAESSDADGQSKRVYDQAYLDLTRGNYSLAILGFKEFLRRVPDSDISDNAQYWIGESYYMQGDHRQAVREYSKVLDSHPAGDRVPSALYKLGLAQLQLGDRAKAVDYLREVYERFPDSEEARLSRDKLDSMN